MERTGALKTTVCGIVILLSMAAPSLADTHYISSGQSIQAAIDAAANGDEIEVAPGDYTESINFNGKAIRLYSSYRSLATIYGDGADHVVQCISGEDANTILDGFTITGGDANGSGVDSCGGGMLNIGSSPTVNKCEFTENSADTGGGIANLNNSKPTITGCMFASNVAGGHGGAMYNDNSAPLVTNCLFGENTAGIHGGGMMNNVSSNPTVANCIFSSNTAGACGGGMANSISSSPIVINCTIYDNAANGTGGGIYNYGGSPTITNCILWDDTPDEIRNDPSNPVVTYCDIKGDFDGAGNIDADPCFNDAAMIDFGLKLNSPCIDAGDSNKLIDAGISQDIQGLKRFVDVPEIPDTGIGPFEFVDMGAFELNYFKSKAFIVNDANGAPVSFSLSGGGWAELIGEATNRWVILHDTAETSVLKILTKGKTETSIDYIKCQGPLKAILAKTTNLRGGIEIGGSLGAITLNDVGDAQLLRIGTSANPKAAVTIKFDQCSDFSIISKMPVKSLTVTGWNDGSLYAPSVGSITAKGDKKRGLAGNLAFEEVQVSGNIGTVKAAGTLSGDWTCNSIKSISAIDVDRNNLILNQLPDAKILALGSMTAKTWIVGSKILSQGNIGKVTAGGMCYSRCFAGVAEGITGLPAAEESSFVSAATIKSITIKGIKSKTGLIPSYQDSDIAATNILIASIVYPQSISIGTPFGLTADYIKKLVIKGDKTISLKELDTAQTKTYSDFLDFQIRVK